MKQLFVEAIVIPKRILKHLLEKFTEKIDSEHRHSAREPQR